MQIQPSSYDLYRPDDWKIPIIVSTPHVGTELPEDLKEFFTPEALKLPDTDWFVDQLYSFAKDIGAVQIRSRYSRYVIDLNRPIAGAALYSDSRRQTEVVPTTTFEGIPLYRDGYQVTEAELKKRTELFYKPYYEALDALIQEALNRFGKVLLWDGHSITRLVTSIQAEPFPDLMLGDRDGHTSHPTLVQIARTALAESSYSVAYNSPFKGGQITRHHGQTQNRIYAMQLEMSQDIYLTDGHLDSKKTEVLVPLLRKTLERLAEGLVNL